MSLVKISGPKGSGKTVLAQAIRSYYLSQGCGVLMIDENQEGAAPDLLNKIVVAPVKWEDKTPASRIPWKRNVVVVTIGRGEATLRDLERLAPGFEKLHCGKVFKISTGG